MLTRLSVRIYAHDYIVSQNVAGSPPGVRGHPRGICRARLPKINESESDRWSSEQARNSEMPTTTWLVIPVHPNKNAVLYITLVVNTWPVLCCVGHRVSDLETAMATGAFSLAPADAWETHIHIFDPERHPYALTRAYNPAAASLEQYLANESHCPNIVIVQGTVQGTDNATLLEVLDREKSKGASRGLLRGLVVLDLVSTSDKEFDRLHAQGVRGVRLHEVSWGFGSQPSDTTIAEKLTYTASRLLRLDWVIG